jgi:two-component system response regulator AtoC
MHKILIVDDEPSIRKTLELHLKSEANQVEAAEDLATARQKWVSFKPEIVLLDLMLPDGSGFDLLSEAIENDYGGLTIMITAVHDMERATDAMRIGAYDYLQKPLDIDQLDNIITRAKHSIQVKPESVLTIDDEGAYIPGRITGRSAAVLELHKQIGLASRGYANVLITGESGVGKELVAKSIHNNSGYKGPFVAVNCSAIVATLAESELFGHEKGSFTGASATKVGQLEFATDGTIFLDEIGDLSLGLQVKLLRMLQEREFTRVGGTKAIALQVRIIAATHRNLEEMMQHNEFRDDLYYRLKVLEIYVPPLRARKDDIPLLIKVLLKNINIQTHRKVTRIPQGLLKELQDYDWPGNIRELENRLISAVIHSPGDTLEMDVPDVALKPAVPKGYDWRKPLLEVEKIHIQQVLQHVDGHLGKACDVLGITRPTLRKKITDYELKVSFKDE